MFCKNTKYVPRGHFIDYYNVILYTIAIRVFHKVIIIQNRNNRLNLIFLLNVKRKQLIQCQITKPTIYEYNK